MRHLKNSRLLRVLAEYLRNGSTDFHQAYVIFKDLYIEVFKIKIEDRSFIVVMVTTS